MLKVKVIAAAAAALLIPLSGCATSGAADTSPYAGRHDHNRDAKQGFAAPATTPAAPVARKGSLRPAW